MPYEEMGKDLCPNFNKAFAEKILREGIVRTKIALDDRQQKDASSNKTMELTLTLLVGWLFVSCHEVERECSEAYPVKYYVPSHYRGVEDEDEDEESFILKTGPIKFRMLWCMK